MKICDICGNQCDDEDSFCRKCGSQLPEARDDFETVYERAPFRAAASSQNETVQNPADEEILNLDNMTDSAPQQTGDLPQVRLTESAQAFRESQPAEEKKSSLMDSYLDGVNQNEQEEAAGRAPAASPARRATFNGKRVASAVYEEEKPRDEETQQDQDQDDHLSAKEKRVRRIYEEKQKTEEKSSRKKNKTRNKREKDRGRDHSTEEERTAGRRGSDGRMPDTVMIKKTPFIAILFFLGASVCLGMALYGYITAFPTLNGWMMLLLDRGTFFVAAGLVLALVSRLCFSFTGSRYNLSLFGAVCNLLCRIVFVVLLILFLVLVAVCILYYTKGTDWVNTRFKDLQNLLF